MSKGVKYRKDIAIIITPPSKEHPLGELKVFPKKDLKAKIKEYFGEG